MKWSWLAVVFVFGFHWARATESPGYEDDMTIIIDAINRIEKELRLELQLNKQKVNKLETLVDQLRAESDGIKSHIAQSGSDLKKESATHRNTSETKDCISENQIENLVRRSNLAVGRVYIKNVKYDEYLYPIDGFEFNAEERRICTWIPRNEYPPDHGKEYVWMLEPADSYGEYYLTTTKFHNEMLYASNMKTEKDQRHPATLIKKNARLHFKNDLERLTWILEPSGNGFNGYYIKNKLFGEYLYASAGSLNAERRIVFTWADNSRKHPKTWDTNEIGTAQWILENVVVPF